MFRRSGGIRRMIEIGEYMIDRHGVRSALAGVLGFTMAAALASCSDTPDAQPVASALAAAVESGDFGDVPFSNASAADIAAEVDEMTGGMGDVARSVQVVDVEAVDDGENRQATFEVTWDVDDAGAGWTYTTTARLVPTEDSWAAEWAPTVVHPQLTQGARLVLNSRPAERGEVLGAGGDVIVTDRPVYRIGIDKTRIDAGAATAAAAELAEVVDVDAESFAERVEAAGPKAFVEAITLREEDAAPVLASVDQIEGAAALDDTLALAPTREFARPILGTVGEATAEIIEESGGRVGAGDVVGLSGLQQQYDEQLRGKPGLTVEVVPPEGEAAVVYERAAEPGTPVTTTLDVDLQAHAENLLADVGPPSAIVAVQPSTGVVLAAASGPGGEGYSTATLGQYAPGSTFKIVTALALLRSGMTAETTLSCTPTITVEGKSFKNYSDYPDSEVGDIPLRSVVAHSCNTALIDQHDAVTQGELTEAAAALGLGVEHDPGVPAFPGDVPAQAGATEHAASMIGQGKVLASPLAMATMAASVAAGQTVAPRVVEGAGEAPQPGSLTASEAQVLQELMRAVVEEGSAEFLGDVPGEPLGAKTGTAEYGSDSPPRTHAWMVATQGDLAVAVFVEDGESGSQTAGPLLEEFLAAP